MPAPSLHTSEKRATMPRVHTAYQWDTSKEHPQTNGFKTIAAASAFAEAGSGDISNGNADRNGKTRLDLLKAPSGGLSQPWVPLSVGGTQVTTSQGYKKTFYKRKLPCPPATAFASPEGRALFTEALMDGTMNGFFKLIEQYNTQDEPAFCGLASIAMVLNTLAIDPRRIWKGNWRWFHEQLLDCCMPLDVVKKEGVTLSQAACLARCNGARADMHQFGTFTLEELRQQVMDCVTGANEHIIASYSRKTMAQTGDGHFSPIGGYHRQQDLVLILDVARFKYPPHWVPLKLLYEAMSLTDPATGMPRGFIRMAAQKPDSVMFSLDVAGHDWESAYIFIRHASEEIMEEMSQQGAGARQLAQVLVSQVPLESLDSFLVIRDPLHLNPKPSPLDNCVTSSSAASSGSDSDGGAVGSAAYKGLCCGPNGVLISVNGSSNGGSMTSQRLHHTPEVIRAHLLSELRSMPLYELVEGVVSGLPCSSAAEYLPEKVVMLMLLQTGDTWLTRAAATHWAGSDDWLELWDLSAYAIVAAEAAYLQEQYQHVEAVLNRNQPGHADGLAPTAEVMMMAANLRT